MRLKPGEIYVPPEERAAMAYLTFMEWAFIKGPVILWLLLLFYAGVFK